MKRSYELIVAIAVCVAFASGFVLAKEVYKVPPRHCNYAGAVVKCKA